MRHTRKTLLFYLSIFLFIFLAKASFAQYPGMNRVYSNMAAQNAQRQMNMMNWMMMQNMLGNDAFNRVFIFHILFKDSTKKIVTSRLYNDTVLHKNYLLIVDKKFRKSDSAHRYQRIYPNQTFNIFRVDSAVFTDDYTTINGAANDSCWMFKVISGPISVYSYLSTKEGKRFASYSVVGIQLNGGPIEQFTEDNLRKMIGEDDITALEMTRDKEYLSAIKRYNRDTKKATKK